MKAGYKKTLTLYNVDVACCFIDDKREKKEGKKKPRKKEKSKNGDGKP